VESLTITRRPSVRAPHAPATGAVRSRITAVRTPRSRNRCDSRRAAGDWNRAVCRR